MARRIRPETDGDGSVRLRDGSAEGVGQTRLRIRPVDKICGIVILLVDRIDKVGVDVEKEDVIVILFVEQAPVEIMVLLMNRMVPVYRYVDRQEYCVSTCVSSMAMLSVMALKPQRLD